MANQQNSYTGSQGSGTNNADFAFTFPSFTASEVKVEVDNVVKTLTTHYTVENYNTETGGTVRFTTNNIPTGTTPVRIFRQTDVDNPKATFTAGSSLKANEINDNFKQVRHALQEAIGAVATDRKVQRFNIEADTIDGTLIADDVINSEHYVAGSIDHEHLANDIIDGDNIQDDVINSEHYAAGSIDEEHLSNSAVTQNKIANNSVGTPELINGSVNSDIILDGTIVNADVNASAAIAGTKISPDFGSQNIVTTGTISTGSFTTSGTVDGRDIAADGTKLDTIETNAKDDQTAAEIKTLLQSNKLTASEIATGALDGRYFTETELTNGALDGRYFTETEADARYFNISTGDTIKDGQSFPDNDTTIATTAAINDRIIDLVDDVGGFVPIASETAFPSANPDVNDGAGTLVSIKAIGSTRTPSGGTVTIANGSGSNTVTITGCGSTVLTAGFGVIVETTTTLHTYAFHRLVPEATQVSTVAGISANITTVANNTSNINAVAADASDIGIVAADGTDIGLVAGSISNVNTTAGSITNVNTVAGSISNVNSVAGNISNVNAVHNNASNINSAVSNASNINSAVSNASNINTVAGSISNVNTTAGSISNVNSVASNMANVNNFADRYQIASNNPSTDGGGNALAAGDLYFNTSANELKVYNGSAWQAGVTATGNFAVTTGNTFTGNNIFTANNTYNDNVKAQFGTGADLKIYHNGTDNYIMPSNGKLIIDTGSESLAKFINNGAVELYYDNSKKLETTSDGIEATGTGYNTVKINGQNTRKLYSYHDSSGVGWATGTTSNFGELIYLNQGSSKVAIYATGETTATFNGNDSVELYYDNSKKFETKSHGVDVLGLLQVNGNVAPNSNNNHDLGTTSEKWAEVHATTYYGNGANLTGINTDLVSDTSPQLGGTLDANGNLITFGDSSSASSNRLKFGAGADLSLYHNGGHGYVENKTGDLYVMTSGAGDDLILRSNDDIFIQPQASEAGIEVIGNGTVKLYYDNSLKFQTTADGVYLADGDKLQVGTHNDLEIYHSGNYSKLEDSSSAGLVLRQDNDADIFIQTDADVRISKVGSAEYYIYAKNDNAVELYYDNSKKLETTSSGVAVTGNVEPTGNINVPDSSSASVGRARFGAGGDLQIYHDGSNSFLRDLGGGDLYLDTNGSKITLFADGTSSKTMAHFYKEGAVELYHNTNKKFETTANGIIATGDDSTGNILIGDLRLKQTSGDTTYVKWDASHSKLEFMDTVSAKFGDNNDLSIAHDGSHSYIDDVGTGDLKIRSDGNGVILGKTNGENTARFLTDGAVELYYDNGKQLETRSNGIALDNNMFVNDSRVIYIGNHLDLQFYHDGSHSYINNDFGHLYIRNHATNSNNIYATLKEGGEFGAFKFGTTEWLFRGTVGGAFEAWYDGNKKLETQSTGIHVTGDVSITGNYLADDNEKLKMGNGNDFEIYHDGDNNYIKGVNNDLIYIATNNTSRWYFANDGHFRPEANNSYDIGSTSQRVRNIYTNDLHLSNEGHSNDVDGTWGNWTIQEGESDLFLKNNRSGKKYKFNLTEVA